MIENRSVAPEAPLERSSESTARWLGGRSAAGGRGAAELAYVFYRGHDDHLWVGRLHATGAWSRHRFRNGRISAFGPSATLWGHQRIAVFQAGPNGLEWRCWDPDDTKGRLFGERIETIGGQMSSAPAAALVGPELGAVLYAGRDAALKCRWWRGGCWLPEETIGRQSLAQYTGPAVVSLGPGRLAVFYLGRIRRSQFPVVWWRRWTASGGWSDAELVPGVGRLTRRPAAWARKDGRLTLFYWRPGIGLEQQGLFWRPWNRVTGWGDECGRTAEILDTAPTPIACSGNSWRLVYAGTGRSLYYVDLDRFAGCRSVTALDTRIVADPSACVFTTGANEPQAT